jgi:hypothetical protein
MYRTPEEHIYKSNQRLSAKLVYLLYILLYRPVLHQDHITCTISEHYFLFNAAIYKATCKQRNAFIFIPLMKPWISMNCVT